MQRAPCMVRMNFCAYFVWGFVVALDKRYAFIPNMQSAEIKTRRIQNYAVTQNSGLNFGVASTLQNLANVDR